MLRGGHLYEGGVVRLGQAGTVRAEAKSADDMHVRGKSSI